MKDCIWIKAAREVWEMFNCDSPALEDVARKIREIVEHEKCSCPYCKGPEAEKRHSRGLVTEGITYQWLAAAWGNMGSGHRITLEPREARLVLCELLAFKDWHRSQVHREIDIQNLEGAMRKHGLRDK